MYSRPQDPIIGTVIIITKVISQPVAKAKANPEIRVDIVEIRVETFYPIAPW